MPISTHDVEQLYRHHSERLRNLVRVCTGACDVTVEDACQAAWGRLLHHRERVDADVALGWVVRTALREAERLSESYGRTLGLDEPAGAHELCGPAEAERVELRERLSAIATLPVRQQRLMWLQGLGLSYAEMAVHEGCTRRTVERQLLRAKRAARAGDPLPV